MADLLSKLFRSLFSSGEQHPLSARTGDVQPNYGPEPDPAMLPDPVHKKVLMITHNPALRSKGGQTVKDFFRWNEPEDLARRYIDDVRYASYGYANYEVADHMVVDGYPLKADGFRYDEDSYLRAWQMRAFHQPDGVDYLQLVREFDLIRRIDRGEVDEIWLFGHPYGGYWESIMGGPGAFWCNAPPLAGTEHAARRFVIMGFNFERGVGEMLEDLGHRAESILFKVFEQVPEHASLWRRFIRYHKTHPGQAECGNVHFAPNSERDYDWGNPRPVPSRCDDWYAFPQLTGQSRIVDCREWGGGDIRKHHVWWLRHLPHVKGSMDGIDHNWWAYIIDPNRVK